MIELWRLLDFCRKKYGSPEALEAEKVGRTGDHGMLGF